MHKLDHTITSENYKKEQDNKILKPTEVHKMKVKIFLKQSKEDIEKEVNTWIKRNQEIGNEKITISDIQFTHTNNHSDWTYAILIVYNEI